MIYNVVLVSGIPESESILHIHIATLFFFLSFCPCICHYRVLSRVPWDFFLFKLLHTQLFLGATERWKDS